MSFTKKMRYLYHNLADLQKLEDLALCGQKTNQDLPVISLTTVPRRIRYLKPTLVSLLNQTIPPKEIHINIGSDLFQNQELPFFLQDLKIIKIFRAPKDCGPATKYIPTLERFKNTEQLLIIIDDDMFYSKYLIEDLMRADRESQGKKVFCINGFNVPSNFKSESRPSDSAIKSGSRRVAIIEGCGGYTLRPQFINIDKLKNLNGAPSRAFFDDDIWLSGHLSCEKIEKHQIVTGKRKSLINTIESAISGNRAQLQTDLMNYFKENWLPEEIHHVD